MTDHPMPPNGPTLAHDRDGATRLARELSDELDSRLAAADAALSTNYPGDTPTRQPVHTVYVPGNQFRADMSQSWGRAAIEAIDASSALFTEVAGGEDLVARVRAKLLAEPVEDVRIDFEDGYGNPGDEAEDADVESAATVLALAIADGGQPPLRGIRFKSLEAPTRGRGVRTLTLFLSRFLERGDRKSVV